jgi:uncharacterized protein with HEPN domain
VSRDPLLYLDDIAQAAEKIDRSTRQLSFETFRANDVLFDSVLFNLHVIGEATKKLPATMKAATAWRQIPGLSYLIPHDAIRPTIILQGLSATYTWRPSEQSTRPSPVHTKDNQWIGAGW